MCLTIVHKPKKKNLKVTLLGTTALKLVNSIIDGMTRVYNLHWIKKVRAERRPNRI